MIQKNCENCNKNFVVYPSGINRRFCCEKCRTQHAEGQRVITQCAQCHTVLSKRKCEIAKSNSGLTFCSSSCSCAYWNLIQNAPKRKPEGKCEDCLEPLTTRKKYCKSCKDKRNLSSSDRTLEEIDNVYCSHPYMRGAIVRYHSRLTYTKSGLPKRCEICGYEKFYNVCHIAPVNSFPKTSKLSIINSLKNLVALCPNCHWEFDHNITDVDAIRAIVEKRSL
jgi:hypothetical protein